MEIYYLAQQEIFEKIEEVIKQLNKAWENLLNHFLIKLEQYDMNLPAKKEECLEYIINQIQANENKSNSLLNYNLNLVFSIDEELENKFIEPFRQEKGRRALILWSKKEREIPKSCLSRWRHVDAFVNAVKYNLVAINYKEECSHNTLALLALKYNNIKTYHYLAQFFSEREIDFPNSRGICARDYRDEKYLEKIDYYSYFRAKERIQSCEIGHDALVSLEINLRKFLSHLDEKKQLLAKNNDYQQANQVLNLIDDCRQGDAGINDLLFLLVKIKKKYPSNYSRLIDFDTFNNIVQQGITNLQNVEVALQRLSIQHGQVITLDSDENYQEENFSLKKEKAFLKEKLAKNNREKEKLIAKVKLLEHSKNHLPCNLPSVVNASLFAPSQQLNHLPSNPDHSIEEQRLRERRAYGQL